MNKWNAYFIFIICFLCGTICKIYDDIHDNHIPISDLISEILKHTHTLLYTIISVSDFNFAVLFYLFNISNYFVDSYAWLSAYEKSCFYVLFLPCLFSIGTFTPIKTMDILIYLHLVLGCLFEVYLKFDEISIYKLGFRIIFLMFYSSVLFICSFFKNSQNDGIVSGFTYKIMIWMFGYVFSSCVFQSIQLFQLYYNKTECCPFLSFYSNKGKELTEQTKEETKEQTKEDGVIKKKKHKRKKEKREKIYKIKLD